MMRLKVVAMATAVLLAGAIPASAAGYWGRLPTTTPPLTGNELGAFDTALPGGQQPQTESLTTGQIAAYGGQVAGSGGTRNFLIGGDFGTNPWQHGTSFAAIANTLTYTADQFFALGAAASSIAVSKQTGAGDITQGYSASYRFQRTAANANTTAICFGQALTSAASTRAQGNQLAFRFHAKAGANYSGGALSITVGYGTGSDESAANFMSGSWTGYAAAGTDTSVTPTTTWTSYPSIDFTVPTTATQVGVKICYTPVGTAGANDWVEFEGFQLEVSPTGQSSIYQRQTPGQVLSDCLRYYWQVNEGAATVRYWTGQAITTTVAHIQVLLPLPMRAVPTTTVTAGAFAVSQADGSAQALTTLAVTTAGSTVSSVDLTATASAANLIAGNATALLGGASTGKLAISAEL